MNQEQIAMMQEQTAQHLIDKGRLVLTVNVTTKEQAEQLLKWMFGTEKPMKAELLELAWDKEAIAREEFQALQQLKAVLADT